MDVSKLKPGDWVIYRKQKSSTSPGERAIEVRPASGGETYFYMVDKFWIVDEVLSDGTVRLRTRRGKQHTVDANDLRLRTPRWWERWMYRNRFEAVTPGSVDA
ncbi:hypothetical protein Poly51_08050 [Rubripirellula tenax]|uniref:Uncharacterized protein n=1 Tax=Rubripirellula tenax TaxID=2528015 RepID=A0A5C6FKD4_9BACT|nr:hypothetical protein [Rubripirellula tenax]TWU60529.1 hypothetical protein Poly51_08050 [Rubripirellula tenax]